VIRLHPAHWLLHASAAKTLAKLDFLRRAVGYIADTRGISGLA
jgi:hypothetical protein